MAKANKSRYAILGMLALEASSGYQIKREMEESTSNFWHESYGQIYPILKLLTEEGLATSHTEKQEGKPERNIYTITERGKEELINWLGEEVEETPERSEILLKLFFGHLLPTSINRQHVQRYQKLQKSLLKKYQDIEAFLRDCAEKYPANERPLNYSLITVRYGILRCQALLAWCEETLTTLDRMHETDET
jgi:DNA-binding PadR family transcriptional regulator